MGEMESLMLEIKKRLQRDQAVIRKTNSDNDAVRHNIRAELDALWACVEVLAQSNDGRARLSVPDYFGDRKIASSSSPASD